MSKLILVVLSLSLLHNTMAQELLPGAMRLKTVSSPACWSTGGQWGGRVSVIDPKHALKGVRLDTTRIANRDGHELWSGCLKWKRKPILVVPGIKYVFTVKARGDAPEILGVAELPWRYSAAIIASPSKKYEKSNKNWVKRSFEYTPSSDKVMACVPFVTITGWREILEIRSFSFTQEKAEGTIKVKTGHFMASPNKSLDIEITSSSYPVRLFLYGPDGTSGAGGEMGGSGAWCDHFKKAIRIKGENGKTTQYKLAIPAESIEGTYRLVAVNESQNAMATTRFTVRPPQYAKKIIDLVNKIQLPNGSRMIFVGDSLTDFFRGRNYVSLIERALKWKYGNNIEVINAGVGGDNIKKIQARLERDVISKNPTHIFIFEGANDIKRLYDVKTASLRGWAIPPVEYEKTYRDVVKELKDKTKAKIIIATCAPADQNIRKMFHNQSRYFGISSNFYGTPKAEKEVVAIQKKIAADYKLDCLDSNAELNKYMRKNREEKLKQFLNVDDGVHLSEFGNREMARIVLKHLSELKGIERRLKKDLNP